MPSITLKAGREKSMLRRHPWVFSGAIAQTEGVATPGETVEIFTAEGKLLGRGAYSPHSQIRCRVWSFDLQEPISPDFFATRLQRAIMARKGLTADDTLTAYRLVNAESDGLPGIIVDRYSDFLVCQFLSTGAEYWKHEVVTQLQALIPTTGIYERSDAGIRQKEGLPPCTGVLSGQQPPKLIEIHEYALRFLVDICNGQKTGFYLDQRENRAVMTSYAAHAEVLNCFAYTGGFSLYALRGGAVSVTNVENSSAALDLAHQNIELNGFDLTHVEQVAGNVFQVLRQYRDACRFFDLIVLDPPKFAESRSQLASASRGYKDINLLAFKLLRPGGVLFTFSCSGLMTLELFQKIAADAALDAQRDVQILRRLTQAPDHPIALNFPEGTYLKGLVCQAW